MKKLTSTLFILLSLPSFAKDLPFSKEEVEAHFMSSRDVSKIEYDLTVDDPKVMYKGHSYPLNETLYSFNFPLIGDTATRVSFFAQFDQKVIELFFFHNGKNVTNIKCESNAIGVGTYHTAYIKEGEIKHNLKSRGHICIFSLK